MSPGLTRILLIGLGTAVVPLDITVNVAFPSITRHFDLPIASIQWVIPSVDDRIDTEFACLPADELAEGDAVVVRNLTTGEVRCAGVLAEARFRVGIPADTGDTVQVEVYRGGRVAMDYGTCEWRDDMGGLSAEPELARTISTWESTFGTRMAEGTCELKDGI